MVTAWSPAACFHRRAGLEKYNQYYYDKIIIVIYNFISVHNVCYSLALCISKCKIISHKMSKIDLSFPLAISEFKIMEENMMSYNNHNLTSADYNKTAYYNQKKGHSSKVIPF